MTVIVTACTQKKRVAHNPLLAARDLPRGPLSRVATIWTDRLEQAHAECTAINLYSGRSFLEATKAAQASQADLYIVSAGLGFVHGSELIPSYDLTVSKGSDGCIMDKLVDTGSEACWWAALGGAEVLISVIRKATQLVVIGLPSPYLRMIAPALAQLSDEQCDKVRIVGGRDVPNLDSRLEDARLPYDDRLDGPKSPLPGTRSDFASRATRHFVEEILLKAPKASVATHRMQVEETIATWTRPATKSGMRMSDLEIKSAIQEHWSSAGGRSTKILRILRDELNIACEQKRFARLAAIVREEDMQ